VTWNLFDHGAIANNVRLQDARLQQLLEEYQRTVLRAAREIDDAAVTVVRTASQQRVLAESVGAARRSLDLANTRYREGYADFQRVLDAQRALFSQAERELITQGAHVGAVIELYKALGGGWLEMPLQEVVPAETRETMRDRTDWGGLLGDPHRAPAPNEQTPTTGSQQHE
jgi:outer membrane protein TolC